MDISVKGLDPDVVRRLAEQAEAEGVSAQEWMRRALQRAASLLTPNELLARSAERTPVTNEVFAEIMDSVVATRASGNAEAVRAGARRRGR